MWRENNDLYMKVLSDPVTEVFPHLTRSMIRSERGARCFYKNGDVLEALRSKIIISGVRMKNCFGQQEVLVEMCMDTWASTCGHFLQEVCFIRQMSLSSTTSQHLSTSSSSSSSTVPATEEDDTMPPWLNVDCIDVNVIKLDSLPVDNTSELSHIMNFIATDMFE